MTPQEVLIKYEKSLDLKKQALLKFELWCQLTCGVYYEDGKKKNLQEDEHDAFVDYCEGFISWERFMYYQKMDILFNCLAAYSGGKLGWNLAQSYFNELCGTVDMEFINEEVIGMIHKYAQ